MHRFAILKLQHSISISNSIPCRARHIYSDLILKIPKLFEFQNKVFDKRDDIAFCICFLSIETVIQCLKKKVNNRYPKKQEKSTNISKSTAFKSWMDISKKLICWKFANFLCQFTTSDIKKCFRNMRQGNFKSEVYWYHGIVVRNCSKWL